MQSSCSTSNTPLGISLSVWEADVANGTASSSSTSTSTSASNSAATATITTTATPSSTSAASSNQLSSSAKIGIGVGCAAAAVAVLGAVIFYILRRRRRNTADEMNPMMADAHNQSPPPGLAAHQLADLPYGHADSGSTMSSTAGSKQANTWASSPSVAGAPWSPSSYNSINTDGQHFDSYRPPPLEDIYELASDGAHSSFAGPPVELPTAPEAPSQIASTRSGYSELDDISSPSPWPEHHELSANADGRSLM